MKMTAQETAIEEAIADDKRELNALTYALCEVLRGLHEVAQAGACAPPDLAEKREAVEAEMVRLFIGVKRLEENQRDIAAGRKSLSAAQQAELEERHARAKAELKARKQERIDEAERVRSEWREAVEAAHRNPGPPPAVAVRETYVQRAADGQRKSSWSGRIRPGKAAGS